MIDDFQMLTHETDECLVKGICSVNPTLSSIQEIILLYARELSFYVLKLTDFDVKNEDIKNFIMEAAFSVIINAEYNQDQFHKLISTFYDYINQSKALYHKICTERDIEIESNKSYFKYTKSFNLTDAIKKGEKYFLKKINSFSQHQRDLYDTMLFLAKSIVLKIIEIQRLGKDYEEAYYMFLSLLDAMKPGEFSLEEAKNKIKQGIETYYNLVKYVYYTQIKMYGQRIVADVPFSIIPGKALLVSGSDFKKLENVLEAVKGTDINVYTHGMEMFIAHSFPKFHTYPNLKGHYGAGLDSSLIDFASFPGAILMTKATLQRLEYLYRGRLFTLDPVAPPGVIKIQNNDYEPLIKATLEAPGFIKAQDKPSIKVGFDNKEVCEKINQITDKMLKKEIRHLYIVGLLNAPNPLYRPYFEKFFEAMPKDCYAFSLCASINKENVYHWDSFYDYALFYQLLNQISLKIPLSEINLSVFLTRCDKHTIANLLYLKQKNIKNVYSCKCPTTLINPSLVTTLQDIYGIKEMSEPQKDLQDTLEEKEDEQ